MAKFQPHLLRTHHTNRNPAERVLRFETLEDRRMLAVVTVTTDQDVVDFNDGLTSLREAIFATNLIEGADEIQFDFGHDGPATILLTQGELAITDSLTITGSGADLLTIDASGNDPTPDENNGDGSRVFNIDDGNFLTQIDVTVNRLTLTGGDSPYVGGAISSFENLSVSDSTISDNSASHEGGGIFAYGTVTVTNNTISGNSAEEGGGIFSYDTTTITDSTITGNSANSGDGGGINSRLTTTIINSTISDNSASHDGGGIYAFGAVDIIDSKISGNFAGPRGGGIWGRGETTITRSTISGNSTGWKGGGIYASGIITISASTISDNSAGTDGGGILAISRFSSTATISNSTVSGNSAGNNGGGIWSRGVTTIANTTITKNVSDADQDGSGSGGGLFAERNRRIPSLDHTIIAGNNDNSGTADDVAGVVNSSYSLIGVGAEFLAPLADNGGPTLTHALLPGSPAINAGDPALQQGNLGLPEFDQRGAPFARVVGGRIDIGAYESQPDTGTFDGDFDADGDVDGNDFLNWQRNFASIALPTPADGDATGNGRVDGNDLAVWQATYGEALFAESLAKDIAAANEADQSTQAIDFVMAERLLDAQWKTPRFSQATDRRTVFADFADFANDKHATFDPPSERSRPRPSPHPTSRFLDLHHPEILDKTLAFEHVIDDFFAQTGIE